ncbi:YceI family protein [Hyphobacterium marinum]|uniref:YceI family protein n=1 Tax=Hyphobacterium marinum TaxID=3116574 RepID=A0ABU7M0Q7_9PROT|nr:YceI family protein [Hyphobacterium sp. Y6023]MEE2567409.1 YceI family protein [Hyphobacterium sp. Y6023]
MFKTALIALLAAPAAWASDWVVDTDASTMTFETEAFGGPVSGEITDFEADIRLDPDAPGDGRIEARAGVASVDAGSSEFNDPLQSRAGFNPEAHPDARFVSTAISEVMDCEAEPPARCFSADGELTIRGETRPATLDFRLAIDGARATADGQLVVHRDDFGIGGSAWGDAAVDVTVNIHIEATEAP